jgi:hypothetical protein
LLKRRVEPIYSRRERKYITQEESGTILLKKIIEPYYSGR